MEHHGDVVPLLETRWTGTTRGFADAEWPDDEPRLVLYRRPLGDGEVVYFTLGHCRSHWDMVDPPHDGARWPTIDRGSWDVPEYVEILRRAIGWAAAGARPCAAVPRASASAPSAGQRRRRPARSRTGRRPARAVGDATHARALAMRRRYGVEGERGRRVARLDVDHRAPLGRRRPRHEVARRRVVPAVRGVGLADDDVLVRGREQAPSIDASVRSSGTTSSSNTGQQ